LSLTTGLVKIRMMDNVVPAPINMYDMYINILEEEIEVTDTVNELEGQTEMESVNPTSHED
jgi:hypothetical protein